MCPTSANEKPNTALQQVWSEGNRNRERRPYDRQVEINTYLLTKQSSSKEPAGFIRRN